MDNKALKIIKLLSDGGGLSIDSLAEELHTTRRTVYRTLKELEELGYIVDRNHGHPKIVKYSPDYEELDNMVSLTLEERALLRSMVMAEDDDNPLRASLLHKLQQALGNSDLLAPVASPGGGGRKVRLINQAMKEHRCALLVKYASGSSNTPHDRRVEPVAWSANYRELHAFDADKEAMRCFLVSRMKDVQLLEEPWRHEAQHAMPKVDCFWMTGEWTEEVTLDMSLRALNLLHEEHPLSLQYKVRGSKDADRPYRVTLPVCTPQGVARFVMGMGRQCRVVKGTELINYIAKERYE